MLTPDVWFEMDLEPYPTATTTTYRWAPRPYADAGSWKEGRLVSMGQIDRALSDDDGHYEVATHRVVLDDTDGLIRGLLATQSTSYFTGRVGSAKLLSEAGRRAGTAPRFLFRGRISDVQLLPQRQVSIAVTDLVGSAFSNFDLDKTIGVPVGSEHTNLPDDSKGKIYPVIYGEHSDRGAVDENGDPAEKGLLPVIDTGDYHPFGDDTVGTPDVYVSPPRNLTATLIGPDSGSRTYYYAVTAVTSFGETTISNIAVETGCPDSLDVNTYVELTWDAPATGASDVIAYKVYGRSTNPPSKRLDTMNNGGTFVNPETTYRDGRQGSRTDFDREKSPGPPKTNTAILSRGADGTDMAWGRLVVSIGSINVQQVYGSDLADGDEPIRTELDIEGSDLITSNSSSWPHSDPFVEVGGIRQTVIYMRGPRLQAHREGTVTVAVNACGYEDVGDGSGTMISQAFYQWQHLINEHILKDEGIGYRTGTWGPLETYSDGDEQVQTSKFEACQALSIERIGGLGYLGAIAIHEPTTVREIVRRFNLTFDAFLGVNHHGQIFPALIDERVSPSAGRLYHQFEIIDLGEQRFDHDALETKITYDYDWDSDAQAFRAIDQVVEDVTAGEALKGPRFGDVQELFYTRHGTTARDTRLRRIFRRRRAPRYVSPTVNLVGLEDDLADPMRLTHYNGLGTTGDVNTPGFIRRHRVNNGTVTLEMLDLRRMGTLVTAGTGGAPGVGLVVPPATLVTSATVLAAGSNALALYVPSALALISGAVLAGANQIALTVPGITATGGAISRVLGANQLVLCVPIAEVDDGMGLKNLELLTNGTGATYTVPAGITKIRVRVQGAGGGGGGADGNTSNFGCGAGGDSGAYAEKTYTVTPSQTFTYTVSNAGGAGGTAGNNAGTDGSATTFDNGGTIVTAGGGVGGGSMAAGTGVSNTTANTKATATNGELNVSGMQGLRGWRFSGTQGISGHGASSPLGGGGIGGFNSDGQVGAGYGSGGGGGASTTTTDRAGGNGAPGLIIVEEYGV